MIIEVNDKVLKTRHKNLVIYDVDYLLDHLAREIYLLESYRKNKNKVSLEDFDAIAREIIREGV